MSFLALSDSVKDKQVRPNTVSGVKLLKRCRVISVSDFSCDYDPPDFSPLVQLQTPFFILAEWGLLSSTEETYCTNPPSRVTHTRRKFNPAASHSRTFRHSSTHVSVKLRLCAALRAVFWWKVTLRFFFFFRLHILLNAWINHSQILEGK